MEEIVVTKNTDRIKGFLHAQGWIYSIELDSTGKSVKLNIKKDGIEKSYNGAKIQWCFVQAHKTVLREFIDVCYLCGEKLDGEIDDDHVPPRQFYPREFRLKSNISNMFTLPTHKYCNKSYQADEDYFKKVIGSLSLDSESGAMLYKDIKKSIKREPDRNQLKMIVKGFSRKIGSIYLPPELTALKFDGERVWRVIWKITRGLFFKEYGVVLPEQTPKYFISLTYGNQKQPDEFAYLNSGSRGLHPKVLDYKYFEDSRYKGLHIWAFLFWETIITVLSFHDPNVMME